MEDSEKFECVIANLRCLLEENSNGVWLSNLSEKYQERFGYYMAPELLGFDGLLDLVTNFPSIIEVKECRAERDKLLFPASGFDEAEENGYRKETRVSTEHNRKEEVHIPKSVLQELKKLLSHNEKGLFTDALLKEYRIMYQKQLNLAELGFPNLDSFLLHLETRCAEFSFRHVGDRGYIISLNDTLESANSRSPSKKSDSSSGNFDIDTIPSEACYGDISLGIDPFFEQVTDGDVFEIEIAEVESPEKFYITHLSRFNLLKSLMADLDQFYKSYEKHYKIPDSVISRDLLCACAFSKTSAWHRARINHVNWTSKEAEVVYVDYGTIEIVSLEKLRFLHKDFAKYPALCFLAGLSGIQPKEGFNYSTECSNKFYRFISVRDLEVEVVKVKPEFLEVSLFARGDEGKINVGDEMIKNDLVRRKGITRADTSPTKSLYEEKAVGEHIPILEYDGSGLKTIRGKTSRLPSFTRTRVLEQDQVADASFTSDHEVFESTTNQAAERLTSRVESPDFLTTLGRPTTRMKTSLHEDAILTPDLEAPENLPAFLPESSSFSPPYSVPPPPLIPQGPPYEKRYYASVPPNANFPYPPPNMYQNYYPMMQPNFPPTSYAFPPPAFANSYPNLSMPYAHRPPIYQNLSSSFRPPPGITTAPKWPPYTPFSIPTNTNVPYQNTLPLCTNYFGNNVTSNDYFPAEPRTPEHLMGSHQSCVNTHPYSNNKAGGDSCRCKFCPPSTFQNPSRENSTQSQDRKRDDDQKMTMEKLLHKKLVIEAAIEREWETRSVGSCTKRSIPNCVETSVKSNVSVEPSHLRSSSSLTEPRESRNTFRFTEKKDGGSKAFFEKPLFAPNMYHTSDKGSTPVEKKISRDHESAPKVTLIDDIDDHEDCACKLCSVSKPESKKIENTSPSDVKLCGGYLADEEEDDMEDLKTIDKETEKLKKALRIAESNEDSEDSAYASPFRGKTPELRETDVIKDFSFNKSLGVKPVEDECETSSLPSPSLPKTENSNCKSFSSIRAFVLQEAKKLSPSKE